MTTSSKIATYKGRTYRLLWIGDTKFGRRAHLGFTDGSKDFWVDASLVSVSDAYSPTVSRPSKSKMTGRCWECGGAMPQWLADQGEECGNC